ncbi:hypothetical protein AVEN_242272-1 [Araneus ventricosus]|uniref:Uncharacterized protein n=1 Tax=Araneus ventricosus TaxID=182803 RepID=A0A4Y2NYA6_ARAVE|nr:hypothetical protein AVEN_242272-1 [Araneus ventricosus]
MIHHRSAILRDTRGTDVLNLELDKPKIKHSSRGVPLSCPGKEYLLTIRLDINQCPSIVVSIAIYKVLTVEIWHDSVLPKAKSYHFILGEHNKCDRWTKFDSLLSWLAAFKPSDAKTNEKIGNAIHLIKDAYAQQDDSDNTLFFSVIIEELKLT